MKSDKLNNSCVYLHINPLKQEIFYVGIGNEKRPYSKLQRNRHWKSIVKKYGYIIVIIHEKLFWEEACKLEKHYIAKIGRKDKRLGTLVNYTDGGEGTPGFNGRDLNGEKNPFYGKQHSNETKSKISQTKKNQNATGVNSVNYGKKFSEESRKKMRADAKNNENENSAE